MELYSRTEIKDDINVTNEFIGVGIYELTIMMYNGVRWRYYCKSPSINKGEFKNIVDDLMIKCRYDIEYVGRELKKLGFEPLMVDEKAEYDFKLYQ